MLREVRGSESYVVRFIWIHEEFSDAPLIRAYYFSMTGYLAWFMLSKTPHPHLLHSLNWRSWRHWYFFYTHPKLQALLIFFIYIFRKSGKKQTADQLLFRWRLRATTVASVSRRTGTHGRHGHLSTTSDCTEHTNQIWFMQRWTIGEECTRQDSNVLWTDDCHSNYLNKSSERA